VKPGVLLLARQTNALILPISIGIARRFVARSWDRHRVPLPFGRCVYVIGEPIDVGKADERSVHFTTEDLEAAFARLAASHPLCARDAALS
jgi:lysophospholipid acyltransferase (LPLAT)-like uncharacterized protein